MSSINYEYLSPGGQIGDLNKVLDYVATNIEDLQNRINEMEIGDFQMAFVDYSDPENQTEMVPGTYYYVPFNSEDEYVQIDTDTFVGSDTIAYFKIYVKGNDGTVTELLTWYPEGNLEGVAYLTQYAVFENGIAKSVNGTFINLTDTQVVTKGEVLEFLESSEFLTNVSTYIGSATTTRQGLVELATDAEAYEGIDTERAITPSNLWYVLDAEGYAKYTVRRTEPYEYTDRNIFILV